MEYRAVELLHDATLFTSSFGQKRPVKKGLYRSYTKDLDRAWRPTRMKKCFHRCPSYLASAFTFPSEILLVYVCGKNPFAPYFLLLYLIQAIAHVKLEGCVIWSSGNCVPKFWLVVCVVGARVFWEEHIAELQTSVCYQVRIWGFRS